MGARLIKRHGVSSARRKREFRAFAAIASAVALPLILAFILVAADMRSDLSELLPSEALPDLGTTLIGWRSLEAHWQPHGRVRMLGYMMDGYTQNGHKPSQDGAPVEMFILLPEAGHVLHPAHRIPDQMVEVWPERRLALKFRSLVWATGSLSRAPATRNTEKALYAMTAAEVQPAVQSDITLWFKP